MIKVNIAEAKAGFSRLIKAAQGGEEVVICERSIPVAELRAIARRDTAPRRLGPPRAGFAIPASFFEPLPDDIQRAFEGKET